MSGGGAFETIQNIQSKSKRVEVERGFVIFQNPVTRTFCLLAPLNIHGRYDIIDIFFYIDQTIPTLFVS